MEREINEYYWNAKVDLSLLEVRNLVCVAELIVRSALKRKESRGLHYTLDYPDLAEEAINTLVLLFAVSNMTNQTVGRIGLVGTGAVGGYYGGLLALSGRR